MLRFWLSNSASVRPPFWLRVHPSWRSWANPAFALCSPALWASEATACCCAPCWLGLGRPKQWPLIPGWPKPHDQVPCRLFRCIPAIRPAAQNRVGHRHRGTRDDRRLGDAPSRVIRSSRERGASRATPTGAARELACCLFMRKRDPASFHDGRQQISGACRLPCSLARHPEPMS